MGLLSALILLMVYIVGFCAPQNPIDFIHLNLEAITARQERILQKFDDQERNMQTQLQEQERIMKTQLQEQERNMQAQLQEQERIMKTQLQGQLEEIQKCATHHQADAFKNILVADECSDGSHKCSASATCIDMIVNYMCTCMEGYSGDGITCQDINECDLGEHMCHTNATCTNTIGNYTCECISSFDGDGYTCNDINECESGEHMCHANATCTNTNGGYTCECISPFDGDGYTCNDINECESGEHMCHTNATCINTNEGYTCECISSFDGDGYTCNDINECESGEHLCHNYASCTNTNGNYTCKCLPGYNGDGYICNVIPCQPPSQVIPGLGCLIPVRDKISWNSAQNECQRRGGRLVEGIKKEHLLPLASFDRYFTPDNCPATGLLGGVWVKSRDPVSPQLGYPKVTDQTKHYCGGLCLGSKPRLYQFTCSRHSSFLCQLQE